MASTKVNTPPTSPASTETALTPRGRKTRDAVLDAAQRVFETVGFLDARVEQITQEAQVSYGTFYRYFDSKEDVFGELSTRLFERMLHQHYDNDQPKRALSPAAKLVAANRAYYAAYRDNAKMMAIVEQVATFNQEFRDLRHHHRSQLIDRTAAAISRWQQEGLVRRDLKPTLAARALAAMVDHTLYLWLIGGDEANEAALLDTLDQMCVGALGLGD